MSEEKESKLAPVENKSINELELEAYEKWKTEGHGPIPLEMALSYYELYLNAFSCTEIYRINGRSSPLGSIGRR
jgi:hypothetical protein